MSEFEESISKLLNAVLNKHLLLKIQENEENNENNDFWLKLLNKRMEKKESKVNEDE